MIGAPILPDYMDHRCKLTSNSQGKKLVKTLCTKYDMCSEKLQSKTWCKKNKLAFVGTGHATTVLNTNTGKRERILTKARFFYQNVNKL